MKCKLFILFGHGRFYKDVFGLTSVLSVYTIGEREQRKTDKRHDRQTRDMTDRQTRWGLSKEDQTRHMTDKDVRGTQ